MIHYLLKPCHAMQEPELPGCASDLQQLMELLMQKFNHPYKDHGQWPPSTLQLASICTSMLTVAVELKHPTLQHAVGGGAVCQGAALFQYFTPISCIIYTGIQVIIGASAACQGSALTLY
jgi:hypothetical protein